MDAKTNFFSLLTSCTENFLTKRKKHKLRQKMKVQARHWIVDWLDTILWAICMVILVNQYLFQMYRIPSGSMSGTLEVGDMIFVNKLVYGPELLPGIAKINGYREVKRGEVVVFENPVYLSKGPVFNIVHQFVYMCTLTLVDIDKDEAGNPRVQYLIKRAVAMGGDRIHLDNGEISFKFRGTDNWITERDYQKQNGFEYPLRRLVKPEQYPEIKMSGKATSWNDMDINSDKALSSNYYYDELAFNAARMEELSAAYPHDTRFVSEDRKNYCGWYIPEDRIFTMGDNRDNSQDARWFGPVSLKKVLGHAIFVYWPINRAGRIK